MFYTPCTKPIKAYDYNKLSNPKQFKYIVIENDKSNSKL